MKTQTDHTDLRNCMYYYIYCYISLYNKLHLWHLSGLIKKNSLTLAPVQPLTADMFYTNYLSQSTNWL